MMTLKIIRYCFFLFLPAICCSCKKREVNGSSGSGNNDSASYRVEDFRKPGMTDTEVIQAALDSIPEGSELNFDDREYVIGHTLYLHKSLTLNGPAVLKREDQIGYQLSKPASSSDKNIVLNTVAGLKVGDQCFLSNGDGSDAGTSQPNIITNIEGNTITLIYPLRSFINGDGEFSAGTHFIKDIKFFWIKNQDDNVFPTQRCSFSELTFDGNRAHNSVSYSWRIHSAIMALTLGPTHIDQCTFINSPGETVVGHNCIITNSTFRDLNGSAFHTSMDRQKVDESQIHSTIRDNHFENTNEVSTYVGGHSEGCITHSNSGGYYTATGNTFINVGEAVIATLYPSVSPNDWGTSNILFTGNIIDTDGKLVRALATHVAGEVTNVRIIDNVIKNVKFADWSAEEQQWPDVVIQTTVNTEP